VRLYRHQPFAKCDTCTTLRETSHLASGEHREATVASRREHLAYVTQARKAMEARRVYARAHPSDVLYINIDGMDQEKTNIPHEMAKSKSDDVGMPLVAKLMGAIAYGRGWWGFWSFPEWSASSNLTLTCLCKMFRDIAGGDPRGCDLPSARQGLPPVLHLQMDNTAKDNKNHYLLGFCGMLLAEGVFREVRVFFLPVGHTHQEIDQTFSRVAASINNVGAYCLEDLMQLTQGAWGKHETIGAERKVNSRLDHALDFRRLLRYDNSQQYVADAEDGEADAEDGPMRMHSFQGLGTDHKNHR